MVAATRAALCILILSVSNLTVSANEDCNELSGPRHQVVSRDFAIARQDKKTLFCAAFFCSPNFDDIELKISSYEHHKQHTTIIYSGPNTVALADDCQSCDKETIEGNCKTCPEVSKSRNVEIHIRIDNPTKENYKNNTCVFPDFFNMTVITKQPSIKTCDGYNVAFPVDNTCKPSSNTTEEICIIPTCKDHIENQTLNTDIFLHQFPLSSEAQTCLLQFTTLYPSVQVFVSPNVKESIYIYSSSLLDVKLNIKHCDPEQRSFTIQNANNSFYVLYKNVKALKEKGFLTIKTARAPCHQLPTLRNGSVENITIQENEAFKFYCDEGFTLSGASEIVCEEILWTQIPTCFPNEKLEANFMSDEAKLPGSRTIRFDPVPLPYEGARSPILTHYEAPSKRLEHQKPSLPSSKTPWEEKDSNASVINLDSESPETATQNIPLEKSIEGSGLEINEESKFESLDEEGILVPFNESSYNATNYEDEDDYELSLISIPTLENNFILIVSVGVGLLFILIATICSVICFRKKCRCRSGATRKFDTFQNPIYEKPVQVPVSVELTDQEKLNVSETTESSHLN